MGLRAILLGESHTEAEFCERCDCGLDGYSWHVTVQKNGPPMMATTVPLCEDCADAAATDFECATDSVWQRYETWKLDHDRSEDAERAS
jgi:hypothetical protein